MLYVSAKSVNYAINTPNNIITSLAPMYNLELIGQNVLVLDYTLVLSYNRDEEKEGMVMRIWLLKLGKLLSFHAK